MGPSFSFLLLCKNHIVLFRILIITILVPWVNSTAKSSNSNRNHNSELAKASMHKHISSAVHRILRELDGLQVLDYGEPCDSIEEEKERHALNDLVAQIIRAPKDDLFAEIQSKQQKMLQGAKSMCNYSRGLACDEGSQTCNCYTGSRHGDIFYEPVRENGTCKLDEMSRCYSPGYLVSRGASVIPCITGAKCVGEVSGRRCVSPLSNENCYCQRPCPDGSFSNVNEELRKCIARLEEISVLSHGDNCSLPDQVERDEVVASMEQMERAGPIIRAIKRLLATQHLLCSPQEQLVCSSEAPHTCVCGPDKDLFTYERYNESCVWSRGSRCFPQDLYSNVTGSNGTCIYGTECFIEGTSLPCTPALEEPFCYCQNPQELLDVEGGALTSLLIIGAVAILVGAVLGYLVYAKKISCPPGSSPANV
jgi:hypothetical protein